MGYELLDRASESLTLTKHRELQWYTDEAI